ncbi:MAG: hypothetical protein ACE5I5_11510 [Candidatus Heimdallarchaeota archaeon]
MHEDGTLRSYRLPHFLFEFSFRVREWENSQFRVSFARSGSTRAAVVDPDPTPLDQTTLRHGVRGKN